MHYIESTVTAPEEGDGSVQSTFTDTQNSIAFVDA
jgi:hypothetical protein